MKAFPTEHPISGSMGLYADGMDLRDYFAGEKIGISFEMLFLYEKYSFKDIDNIDIESNTIEFRKWFALQTIQTLLELECKYRYEYADAMMKAREQ